MATELTNENYHDSDRIRIRERDILDKWAQLLAALDARRRALMSLSDLMGLLRDIDTLSSEIRDLEVGCLSLCDAALLKCISETTRWRNGDSSFVLKKKHRVNIRIGIVRALAFEIFWFSSVNKRPIWVFCFWFCCNTLSFTQVSMISLYALNFIA